MLASRFPLPLEKGDKLRLYHHLRYLAQSHEIYLVSLTEEPFEQTLLRDLELLCREIYVIPHSRASNLLHGLWGLLRGWPASVGYFFKPSTYGKVRAVLERIRPDAIYVQLIRMATYTEGIRGARLFIDYMDAFSLRANRQAKASAVPYRWFWQCESWLISRYERRVSDRFELKYVIAETDRDWLENRGVSGLQLLSNGVDSSYFSPSNHHVDYDLVFVGNLSYEPNMRAAQYLVEQIGKTLKERRPGLRILLAGARPHDAVVALTNDWVHLQGDLEDIRVAYASGRVFVAPITLGSGQQNKILEAMAMGLPCVTSIQVADGIGADPELLLVADQLPDYAAVIEELLDNDERRHRLGQAGRAFVMKHFDWHQCSKALGQLDGEV